MTIRVIHGDCREVLAKFEAESFAACVTDPPYHLTELKPTGQGYGSEQRNGGRTESQKVARKGFMGKAWDGGDVAFCPETWVAVLRVLKPGAYLVAFASTRGYHRMACAIEDAGFIIHPMLGWIFASGFPKAHRVHAEGWEGWRYGLQSLKPALEPICLAQKPMSEATGTANVLRHGTGALNIDASRVPTDAVPSGGGGKLWSHYHDGTENRAEPRVNHGNGRWPANLCHDCSPEVLEAFARFGESPSSARPNCTGKVYADNNSIFGSGLGRYSGGHPDTGTAARFFFSAKAASWEREGSHPTVKPIALMEWLIRLVTPPGGTVLDPFCGTGSTLVACDWLGFDAVGIEQDAQTCRDAEAKIKRLRARRMLGDFEKAAPLPGQLSLL